ncbi:hypothetical protein MN869_13300 [Acinetobacter sp. NIPH1876]|uniref:hypothetical protein n=1 Tax=unclassified Acinetobacter TaxID=196816 RepID=UPI001FAB48E9|nr:hypothetical protein [Acinetobacter sp. NIPH1876]MCJ0829418.1 hypothetical protein [Acinetobacter sp. NIPH1876]
MNFLKTLMIFFIGLVVSSCSFSKENNQNFDVENKKTLNGVITREKVSKCKFEQGYIDFCSDDYLNLYNNALSRKINFAQNKIALIIDKQRDTGKGVPRKVKYFIVLDPRTKKVYPLEQSVGYFVDDKFEEIASEPPIVKFSQINNQICLSGTTFSYQDNNVNVENECYIFNLNERNFFKKIVR